MPSFRFLQGRHGPHLLNALAKAVALPLRQMTANDCTQVVVLTLHVVAGVPVAVVVEGARELENASDLFAARAQEFDGGLRGSVPVLEGPLLLSLSPETSLVPVRFEQRVDVDKIDAR